MTVNRIVFFQGDTQYQNTGDVLINKSLLQHLRTHADVIVNDVNMPGDYIVGLGLTNNERITNRPSSFVKLLIKSSVKALFNSSLKIYFIAGPPGHLFGNSKRINKRNLISVIVFPMFRLLNITIIKIGLSLGPLGKELAITERLRAIFINHYLVRDSLSLLLAHQIGINKAKFFPDFAWSYKTRSDVEISKKSKVLLSFRDSIVKGTSDDSYLDNLINSLLIILKQIDKDIIIEIVYQVGMDYDFCKKLYSRLNNEFKVTFNEQQITLTSAEVIYNDGICIITNRLHAALLAYKYGALPIILTDVNNHIKIKGIYEDAGIEDLLLNSNDDIEINISKFTDLLTNADDILCRIKKVEKQYIEESDFIIDDIFS